LKYLPPFEALKSYLTISSENGELMVHCTYDKFLEMMRRLIVNVPVDEAWYLGRYPDIAAAIRQGLVSDPKSHFVNDGYFEGRVPFLIRVDERYYLGQHPGVADYVRKGLLESGQEHFDSSGYHEGHLPFVP